MNELYLSELLIHNIRLCRESDQLLEYKADIADALCGITIAMDEASTPRVKKLLAIAKDVLTTHHFFVDLMAEVETNK